MIRILVPGAVTLAVYAWLLGIPVWGREFTRFLLAGGALFACYGFAVWSVRRMAMPEGGLRWIWAGAIAFRGVLLFAEPSLSDDLYRYIWDGRVFSSGINPYAFAPDAPEVQGLRNELWGRINHRELPTIYPPLLQAVFALVALVSPTVFGMKLAMAGFDLGAGWLLMRALAASGRSRAWVIAYLWHPLPILEFAGQGHADAVGVFCLAAALAAWFHRRPLGAGAALVAGALVKFLPLAALPLLLPRLRWRWLWLPAGLAAAYAPFALGGVDPLGSLDVFASRWRANDFLFARLFEESESLEGSLREAKRQGAMIVAGVWLAATLLRRSWIPVLSWTAGAALLVSPVVHPWYLTWLLPLALFVPSPAWWVWSGTVLLAYAPLPGFLETGVWTESMALKAWQVVPVLLLLPLQAWLDLRRRGSGMLEPCGERSRAS